MKFAITGSFLLAAFAALATAEEWSWGKDKSAAVTEDRVKPAAADTATDRESKSIDSYSELNDDNSGSSSSQEDGGASVAGNATDTQPRHVIKDRLCGLGLMEVTLLTIFPVQNHPRHIRFSKPDIDGTRRNSRPTNGGL